MLKKFKTYYQKNDLFKQSDNILLTVSGGKDSMAMLHLFNACNLNFGVAHCNFSLRGAKSDADEELVKSICEKHKITFHSTKFNTKVYAEQNGISIQMAARELRYNWFEELSVDNNYDYIATAHHKNDVAETMLINLSKGTGLAGLHGIRNKSEKIIRPLLDFKREEIGVYVQKNNVVYREDKSNTDNKYTRNAIRLDVIPLLEKINPNVIESLVQTANYINEAEQIVEEKVENEFRRCTDIKDGKIYFDITKLKSLTALATQLYYFIKPYGFNAAGVEDIVQSFEEQSGKQFFSKTHIIVKDRGCLILQKITENDSDKVVVNSLQELERKLMCRATKYAAKGYKPRKSPQYANLDYDKIKFPLTIRNWKEGDSFQPFGMKGKKKLSDFFIDNKIDVITKNQTKILTQNDKIIWVIGFRIDDNFKITNSTQNVLLINNQPLIF